MITVAVAGGTGGIGKTIVEELARGKKYNIVVLSRNVSHPLGTLHFIRMLTILGLHFPEARHPRACCRLQ
jgi:NAD(P)-dependent dehydrogenase (short-subunit alcohol dehydrogenase family)